MAAFYTLRLATQNPDVTWDRKNNPEPWQKYAEKQYKVKLPLISLMFHTLKQFISSFIRQLDSNLARHLNMMSDFHKRVLL